MITLEEYVYLSNSINKIMNYDAEFINQGELINMQNLGCGLYLSKNIKKGRIVRENDFLIKIEKKDTKHIYILFYYIY